MAPRSSKSSKRPTANDPSSNAVTTSRPVSAASPAAGTGPRQDTCSDTPTLPFRSPDELQHAPSVPTDDPLADPLERPATKFANPLSPYLKDIRQHALLSPAQEQCLSRQLMTAHDQLCTLLTELHTCLTPYHTELPLIWEPCCLLNTAPRWIPSEWERLHIRLTTWQGPLSCPVETRQTIDTLHVQLHALYVQWTHHRDAFISANLRLVVHVARYYARTTVPLSDLIQAGNLGLMQAIDRFDPRVGTRLSTYSVMWIREAIYRIVSTATHQAAPLVTLEDPQNPTSTPTTIYLLSLEGALHQPTDDYDGTLLDLVPDHHAQSPEEYTTNQELHTQIVLALSTLEPDQRHILQLRHGLQTDHSHTLEEIAVKLNLSRDQVRHKQNQAYEQLRSCSHSHILREFLHD